MAEYIGKNAVIVGSFNPVHYGHIDMIQYGLDRFEHMHLLLRYNEGVDITDWETKKRIFEKIAVNLGAEERITIYKHEPEEKGKDYNVELFYDFIRNIKDIINVEADGFLFGGYHKLIPYLEKEFPDKIFINLDRTRGYSSTEIRADVKGHKDWMPDYVYEELEKSNLC